MARPCLSSLRTRLAFSLTPGGLAGPQWPRSEETHLTATEGGASMAVKGHSPPSAKCTVLFARGSCFLAVLALPLQEGLSISGKH